MPPTPLTQINIDAWNDLDQHRREFDAIVCAGDMHGAPIGGVIAAVMDKPLMVVCTKRHKCCVSHIVMIGDILPTMRFLYVDDMFAFGASKRHVFTYMTKSGPRAILRRRHRLFTYMTQSAPCAIVGTYEASTRTYAKVDANAPTH
jgi:orotate phosphoribosyltransferase-like protein